MSGRAWAALRAVGGRSSYGTPALLARSESAPAQDSFSTVTWAGPEPRTLGRVAGSVIKDFVSKAQKFVIQDDER